MSTDTTAPPAWAKGYDVDYLKRITALFKAHDAGMVHGAFGRFSELDLVAEFERGTMLLGDGLEWAAALRPLDRRLAVKDFTGGTRWTLELGTWYCPRMAWADEAGKRAFMGELANKDPLALLAWQEHEAERDLVDLLGLSLAVVKITAASEMRGLYVSGTAGELFSEGPEPYPRAQAVGLGALPLDVPQDAVDALARQVADLGTGGAQHYSSYNKGGTWTALALRGFYDDPERIEKPHEMNKRWKAEHADEMENEPRDTPLREALPAVEPLLDAIPCAGLERVRLMMLAPGGGELTRHADITDADAGAEPGRVVRIHIPLVSNPECVFNGWDLDGRAHRLYMAPGRAYYLDMRKPHTAYNGGERERLHLVADVVADETLVEALARAEEAPRA